MDRASKPSGTPLNTAAHTQTGALGGEEREGQKQGQFGECRPLTVLSLLIHEHGCLSTDLGLLQFPSTVSCVHHTGGLCGVQTTLQ